MPLLRILGFSHEHSFLMNSFMNRLSDKAHSRKNYQAQVAPYILIVIPVAHVTSN